MVQSPKGEPASTAVMENRELKASGLAYILAVSLAVSNKYKPGDEMTRARPLVPSEAADLGK